MSLFICFRIFLVFKKKCSLPQSTSQGLSFSRPARGSFETLSHGDVRYETSMRMRIAMIVCRWVDLILELWVLAFYIFHCKCKCPKSFLFKCSKMQGLACNKGPKNNNTWGIENMLAIHVQTEWADFDPSSLQMLLRRKI